MNSNSSNKVNPLAEAQHDLKADDKCEVDHVEIASVNDRDTEKGISDKGINEKADIDEGFDPVVVKKLIRRVDWRLIPTLIAMFAISLIDRTNLGLARAANNVYMDKELRLDIGERYNIITVMFFVPYIILELPSQIGLRKFGPRWWLGTAVTCWGIIQLAMGFAKTWGTLVALRALLGAFECALFPGAAYLISCWYPRKEMAIRNVIFYISSAVCGAFTKPIGYGFSLLHMKAGLSGWRWMMILYGVATIIIGFAGYIFLIDFPSIATFLTEEERHIIQTRIERDRADAKPDPMTLKKVINYACELKPWLFAFAFMSATTASYSLAYFMPTILTQMGFGNVESMLLGTPAYFWAVIPAIGSGRISDRVRGMRAAMICVNALFIIVGTIMYSQIKTNKVARFVGIFFAVGGGNANIPLIVAWQQTAVRAQSKRAFSSALTIAFGGTGGILGSVLFFNREAKKGFPTGVWFTVGVNVATILVAIGLRFWMQHKNRKADRGEILIEGLEGFRYQP